ncbi:coiled-coil domain-containing protein 105 isoform X2 [Scleropages formosus]|uniref:coiled-coil domain-containing protein 105 isoform X2 n=1 Tax=Scleropages formosus TaxID=113540 RepID=UPI000878A237|nr:coiled-coil domain-containing protein 105 isoform X2 [Scleropages formosus]
MPGRSVSLAPAAVGARSWRDEAFRSVRRAEQLVRRVGAVDPKLVRNRSHSAGLLYTTRCKPRAGGDTERSSTGGHGAPDTQHDGDGEGSARVSKGAAARTRSAVAPAISTIALPFLREQCGDDSVVAAVGYMRCVRGAEGQLRGLAAKVWLECRKLEREQGHLEKMLRILRKDILVNRKSVEDRTLRPATTETTLKQCSMMLLDCANERARVLDLLPRTGSHAARDHCPPAKVPIKPNPLGHYSPDCGQVMKSSDTALKQSRALRDHIRHRVGEAIARQRAAHQTVNEGLVKKIAETITLKQLLTVSSAETRQAINRKQRQLDNVEHNHGRALGPVSRGDLFSRERLNRPIVQVYQRHPDTELPEAMNLVQGTAMLRKGLSTLSGELAQLNGAYQRLVDNLHGKAVAAKVDSAIVRERRREVDQRGMQSLFLQDIN